MLWDSCCEGIAIHVIWNIWLSHVFCWYIEDFGKTVMVETCTTAALHCHARRHSVSGKWQTHYYYTLRQWYLHCGITVWFYSESHELVVCAGRVAQERRYSSAARRGRRCYSESSSSTPSSSQRSSLSIMSFTGSSPGTTPSCEYNQRQAEGFSSELDSVAY